MNSLFFTLKRALRDRVFLLFLAALLILPPLCAAAGRNTAPPEAGYVCLDSGEEALAICRSLEEFGFLPFTEEAALVDAVSRGGADCGVILPEGLSSRLRRGELAQALTFVDSPSSLLAPLRRAQASAALYAVFAPSCTVEALTGTDISPEEIYAAYGERMAQGKLFSFTVQTTTGTAGKPEDRAARCCRLVLGVLLLAAGYFAAAVPAWEDRQPVELRFGKKRAFFTVFFPAMIVRLCILWFFAAAGAWIAGSGQELFPLLAYIGTLAVPVSALAFLPGKNWKGALVALLCLLSLPLCPVFVDLTLFLPIIAKLRMLLPPWWLWCLVP